MKYLNFLCMTFSKYKKPLIYFIIYIISFCILFFMLEPLIGDQDVSPIIYGDNFIEKIQMFFVWWTIGSIVGALLFGFLLGPFYLFVHKHTIGRNMTYGIQDNKESETLKWLSKAIFPSLMAVNFALMLTLYPGIVNKIVSVFTKGMQEGFIEVFNTLIAFVILLSITVGVAFAIFSPVWFLQDAGIVYSNQDRVREKNLDAPIEARSVGSWYMYLLKGYAGISVILSYFQLVFIFLSAMIDEANTFTNIMGIVNMIIFVPIVIFISIATIPAIILLDLTKEKRIIYIRNWAKRFGITEKVQILFQNQS